MKDDIKRVRKIATKHGMSPEERREFGDYIEDQKRSGNVGSGPRGDFTWDELDRLADDFMKGNA